MFESFTTRYINVPTFKQARTNFGNDLLHNVSTAADAVDHHLAEGVESFVVYMDKHPGFSAVLNPFSVMRRITYRQTDETISRRRS